MSAADPRINYLDRGNIELTPARKLGADLAVGKLLALMDSDDFWAPERLERHVEVCQKQDRKSTRLNSSHLVISYAVFCLKKKKKQIMRLYMYPTHTTP